MKSFFTNLGKFALCGAVVAMIGCTDLQSDIKLVETNSKEAVAELQSALDALEQKLSSDYALKTQLEELNAALADEKAALEAAIAAGDQAAIDAAKADLDAAIAAVKADLEAATGAAAEQIAGLTSRLEALEAAVNCDEVAANLAALDAYVKAAEEEIYKRIETVEETLSSLANLIADETAARQLADEEIYGKIEVVEETITALNNIVNDIMAQEYVSAAQLEEAYAAIETTNETLTNALNLLADLAAKHDQDVEDLYAKIEVVEEYISGLTNRVEDVEDQLAAHLAAFEAYKVAVEEAIAGATEDMQEYFTQLLNSVNYEIEQLAGAHEEIWLALDAMQNYYTQLMNSCYNADAELKAEMEALISETKEELGQTITFVTNLLNDYIAQIEDVVARVQSLVFIPEYTDGKATIEWGLLVNDKDPMNFIQNNILTPGNIAAVKAYLAEFYNLIVDELLAAGESVDTALDGIIDESKLEAAFSTLFQNLWGIIWAGSAGQDQAAADFVEQLKGAFSFSNISIETILAELLGDFKAEGIATAKDILAAIQNTSVEDVLGALNALDIKGILSTLASVVGDLEQTIIDNTSLLSKPSVIRYKVMGQNAAALAQAIAQNPEVLSYDVEQVDVRGAAAGLQITKVEAVGDELHVSVLPQNFHPRFYLTYLFDGSFIYGAVESFLDKFEYTGLISYSAALVLNDGNNIRSTEYVNFVSAENPELFTAEVVKNGEICDKETLVYTKGDETVSLCEGFEIAYLSVPSRSMLSKADLEEMGYLGLRESKKVQTNNNNEAGPCVFDGLIGTCNYWPDYYYFYTDFEVNDIKMTVESRVEWEYPESLVLWEGEIKSTESQVISIAEGTIAPWYDHFDANQEIRIYIEDVTFGDNRVYLYTPSDNENPFGKYENTVLPEDGYLSVDLAIPDFLYYVSTEQAFRIAAEGVTVTKVEVHFKDPRYHL